MLSSAQGYGTKKNGSAAVFNTGGLYSEKPPIMEDFEKEFLKHLEERIEKDFSLV
jgi:hypothetical protein